MTKKKPFFKPVDPKVDFPKMEREILAYWNKAGIVKKYLQKNKNSKKRFSFLDGPITANNPMGVHHAWGRTYKDIWQRYKNMCGFKQRFQNGFDCQGLWVEVEVEKELGLKSKREIENLVKGDAKKSIARFVGLCKARVNKYAKIQTEQSKRLGYFMDWDNSYYTLSSENNYMIWHFLKKCHQKGLIYKGRDSVPWCPRCGTAISQHEILTEDYKELIHDSIFVGYPLNERKDEYLLIWTTTPWTLPANVAVAVDPKLDYVLVNGKDKKSYYLLDVAAKRYNLKAEKSVKGKQLLGLTYTSPFDHLPRVAESLGKYVHRVVSSDERILPVSEEEGTGIIHIATGAGSEDFALGKKEDLPVIEVIEEDAVYKRGLGGFSGKNAKNNPELIINYLKKKGYLFRTEKYKHKYPICWRCKAELVWRVVDEWYIAIDPVRTKMKKVARKIRWIPSFGLKRELDWLSNMHDWLISKKRYWGLALPIWECSHCNYFEVIGGYEELKKKAVAGWKEFDGHSPHRPWVDEIKIKCPKCGHLSERIPDVGNPWLDAGIVPYSTITKNNKGKPLYLTNKKAWKTWFPADFITESFPGQFKNWFYSMIAESTVLENKEPYKIVLGFATLFGEDGRPMHKSLGNAIEFNEGADKIGVDVMRWMYARQNPVDNLLFGYKKADETRRKFHLKLWNIYNFFVTYANLDGWKPKKQLIINNKQLSILDKWIIARLNQTTTEVTKYLDNYDAYNASAEIEELVEDISNWYIRRCRGRVGVAAESQKDKEAFCLTLYRVIVHLAKLVAPFIPYFSEELYKALTGNVSVHLSDWPKSTKLTQQDEQLITEMEILREVVEHIHSQRKKAAIGVRQPLATAYVNSPSKSLNPEFLKLAKEEVNIKKISWKVAKELRVKLDENITPKLREEGRARELVRKIQSERKRMGIQLTQQVVVKSPWIPESKNITQYVLEKTLSRNITKGKFTVSKAS